MKFFVLFLCLPSLSFAKAFEGKEFVVSGPSVHVPQVSKQIFKQGGNIVDMAVASALTLAVTHPYYVSLACGGFALVKMNSSIEALDFRERAPGQTTSDFFQKEGLSPRHGGASVAVPGFIAGLVALHKKHGKLSWRRLVQPAIFLAKNGFAVSGDWVEITQKSKNKFYKTGKQIFFKNGKAYQVNENFKQAKLVKALKKIQKQKSKAFYGGSIGKDLVASVKQAQGVLTETDLKNYKVRWLKPVSISFRAYQVHSMPLPSSGGIILSRALKLIEKQKLYKQKLYSLNELHLLAEVMAKAFRPRLLMGDTQFAKLKQKEWLSDKEINSYHQSISLNKRIPLPPLKESEETTHISLMDSKGHAVSMTLTLNGFYGSHVVSEKYGIVLNNQMDDFNTFPGKANKFQLIQGKNNSVQGGKRPLSSMTPTLVEKNGQTVFVLGGAGGPKIINAVLQTLYRHLVNKMNIEQAIYSPRLHQQFLPRTLYIEDKSFNPELLLDLKMKGHKLHFTNSLAQVFAVSKSQNSLFAAHEKRREGASGGL